MNGDDPKGDIPVLKALGVWDAFVEADVLRNQQFRQQLTYMIDDIIQRVNAAGRGLEFAGQAMQGGMY